MTFDPISRRKILRGALALGGAAVGSRFLPGLTSLVEAQAAGEKSAVLIIYLRGGYNAFFSSADTFGTRYFGVTANNTETVGPGVVVDRGTFGTMPAFAKSHMANIGVRHGISAHDTGRLATTHTDNRSSPLLLASAMGGSAPIKAAILGGDRLDGSHPPEGDVSLQTVNDMQTVVNALGGGTPDPKVPDREIAARLLERSHAMSGTTLERNTVALASLHEAYPAATATLLDKPTINYQTVLTNLKTAYGLGNATRVQNERSKFAAAELMITAGANVVVLVDNGWDSHDDSNGSEVRGKMTNEIMPGLNTFLRRMIDPAGASAAGRNVVVAIMGEFARSLPTSDHAPLLNATVIGKYVKSGTSGKVQVNAGQSGRQSLSLPVGTPNIKEYWAYLAAAAKAPASPFGANPHNLIL